MLCAPAGCALTGNAGHARQGFYTVYGAIFATLAEQEAAACARSGGAGAGAAPEPGFGASGAAWGDVLAFYAHWQGFSTAKGFAWADQYNPGAAANRKARCRWRAVQAYCRLACLYNERT